MQMKKANVERAHITLNVTDFRNSKSLENFNYFHFTSFILSDRKFKISFEINKKNKYYQLFHHRIVFLIKCDVS